MDDIATILQRYKDAIAVAERDYIAKIKELIPIGKNVSYTNMQGKGVTDSVIGHTETGVLIIGEKSKMKRGWEKVTFQ